MSHGLVWTEQPRRKPVWPWVLVAICLLCLMMRLAFEFIGPGNQAAWLNFWGFRPDAIASRLLGDPANRLDPELLGLLTALFIHIDWVHLIGNLAYLWVFGLAVERAVGHWWFVLLFLGLGGLANLYVGLQMDSSTVPVIGASGGVSAIMGIYLGLFPSRRMGLWVPLGLYLQFVKVPAVLVIGSWFTLQLLYSVFGPTSTDVAWSAHIAGFVLGLVAAMLLRLPPGYYHLTARED